MNNASIHLSSSHSRKRSRAIPKAAFGQNLRRAFNGVRILALPWVLLVVYGEHLTFAWNVRSCSWPLVPNSRRALNYKVLLISSPQLPDKRSYPERGQISRWFGEEIIYGFTRKSFKKMLSRHRPSAIIFLGDLLDAGAAAEDRHAKYVSRFKSTFAIPANIQTIYMPGSHDVGLHAESSTTAHAREQFRDAFGPLQGEVLLGNHSFVWIDSLSMLETSRPVAEDSPAWSFVNNLPSESHPRILLSHIPLWRPDGTPCDPHSKRKDSAASLDQTLLNQESTSAIFTKVKPMALFSGSNHDVCEITHNPPESLPWMKPTPEITVGSMGMRSGARRPGYQLLSLFNARDNISDFSTEVTYATTDCRLPDQTGIYTTYFRFAIFTLVAIGLMAIRKIIIASRSIKAHKHKHTRSQSRNYVHGRSYSHHDYVSSDSGSEDENEFGYASSPTSSGGYMYHASGDEDGLPTPISSPYQPKVWRKSRPVRRVSRVYLWDERRKNERSAVASRLVPGFLLRGTRSILRIFRPYITPYWETGKIPLSEAFGDIRYIAQWPLALFLAFWVNSLV